MARSVPRCPYDLSVEREGVLHVHRGLELPLSEVTWRATTSGGPGGQHANRTLSRVEVEFDVEASGTLGPRQRARLLERYGSTVARRGLRVALAGAQPRACSRAPGRAHPRRPPRRARTEGDPTHGRGAGRAGWRTSAAVPRPSAGGRLRGATTIDRPPLAGPRFAARRGEARRGQPVQSGKPKGDRAGPRPESSRIRSSVSTSARGPRRAVSAA